MRSEARLWAIQTRHPDSRTDPPDQTEMMDAATVRLLVEQQLKNAGSFVNLHGINATNVRSLLVDPFQATVDPDDFETVPRPMWVVLQERASPYDGYVVVCDPATEDRGVAELDKDAVRKNVLVVSAQTLQGAFDGM